MRSPLLVLAAVLLTAGCGSSSTSAGATTGNTAGAEQRFLAAVASAAPGAPGKWSNATLTGYGYAACTSLNDDGANPEAAVAAVTVSGVDDATARSIVRAAAGTICPAASAQGLSSSAPAPAPASNDVGQTFTNGGIKLTVTAAKAADSIELNQTNSQPGSGYERYTKTSAGVGAEYVVIQTHVVNNAKTSLDLTCSLPVTTKLVDDQQRNFDPIEDLYKLKGNPECNANVQPGFESDMTWVYRVPAQAKILGWGFQDTTDASNLDNDFTVVHLQV